MSGYMPDACVASIYQHPQRYKESYMLNYSSSCSSSRRLGTFPCSTWNAVPAYPCASLNGCVHAGSRYLAAPDLQAGGRYSVRAIQAGAICRCDALLALGAIDQMAPGVRRRIPPASAPARARKRIPRRAATSGQLRDPARCGPAWWPICSGTCGLMGPQEVPGHPSLSSG